MEIKILCPCGAKFKFDVEPVNGQSPAPVHCPACGKDSTEATNNAIRQQIAAAISATPAGPAAPARISVSAAPAPAGSPNISIPAIRIPAAPAAAASAPAPVSVAAAAPSPAPAAPAGVVGQKVTVMPVPTTAKAFTVKPPGEATEHAPAPSAPRPANASGDPNAPGSPKMAFMPVPTAGTGASLSVAGGHGKTEEKAPEAAPVQPARAHPAAAKMIKPVAAPGTIRFGAGYTGAVIGAIIGMAIWYFTVISTGREFKYLAILVGVCAGGGARLLGGGKHNKLATAAGFSAIVAILLGQYLAIQFIITDAVDKIVQVSYKERIALARDAAAAKTEKDIRAVMARDEKGSFAGKAADSISDEDLAKYRGKELVALQKFAGGSPSRNQYETSIRKEIDESGEAKYEFRIVTLIWIAAGVTSAWKIVKPPEKD